MKFIRSSLFNTIKAILLLNLLMANIYVEASENIKVNKLLNKYSRSLNSKSHKKTSRARRNTAKLMRVKNRISLTDKFKNLFLGFLASMAVKLLKSHDIIAQDASAGKSGSYSTEEQIFHVLKVSVDWCFEQTVEEYNLEKRKRQELNACNPEIVDEVLGNNKVEVHTTCQEKKIIEEMDSNEYSTTNVMFGKFKGLFSDNTQFEKGYQDFKARERELENKIKELNKVVIPHVKQLKESLVTNGKEETEKYKVVENLRSNMVGFFSDNICDGVDKCSSISPFEHIKLFIMTGLSFLKCAAQAQVKEFLWNKFNALITGIFNKIGISIVGTILGAIFPGVLVGLIVKFVFNNIGIISDITKSLLGLRSDTDYNADAALYQSLGRLLGNILIAVTGLRRRKLKKYRQFDAPIFR